MNNWRKTQWKNSVKWIWRIIIKKTARNHFLQPNSWITEDFLFIVFIKAFLKLNGALWEQITLFYCEILKQESFERWKGRHWESAQTFYSTFFTPITTQPSCMHY